MWVYCMMRDVPDLNFVRSWLFELMGELKCNIFCCFARPPMELMVNAKHIFCRLITSFFRPVHSRAVGKLMLSLLYSNFILLKGKLDCQIYANKITCNLYSVYFYIISVVFKSIYFCENWLLTTIVLRWWFGRSLASRVIILSTWPSMMVAVRQLTT